LWHQEAFDPIWVQGAFGVPSKIACHLCETTKQLVCSQVLVAFGGALEAKVKLVLAMFVIRNFGWHCLSGHKDVGLLWGASIAEFASRQS
jgi:hypothetical protein